MQKRYTFKGGNDMKIIFASGNAKKTAEIQRMAPEGIEIICLKDIPEAAGIPQAKENGRTFEDNAIIKAKYWAEILKMPVLAEDSGIEIEALNGYPGIYTKRCVEDLCPGADINVDNPGELYPLLLELMKESGNPSTEARWVSAVALSDSKITISTEEVLQGYMCEKSGEKEFGFDQYFKPLNFKQTLSELLPEVKDAIGPRKRALENILSQFENF